MTVRAEEVGASGARDSVGDDSTQQGHCAAQEASHLEVAGVDCEATTLPHSTTTLVVRTTSHLAASIIVVCIRFISCGPLDPCDYLFSSPASTCTG